MERARVLGFGDHIPVLRPTNPTLLASVKCTDLETLYHAAFTRDPQAFTFVFVGDLPPDEELVPLLEEHLGSLGGGGDDDGQQQQVSNTSSDNGGGSEGVGGSRSDGGGGVASAKVDTKLDHEEKEAAEEEADAKSSLISSSSPGAWASASSCTCKSCEVCAAPPPPLLPLLEVCSEDGTGLGANSAKQASSTLTLSATTVEVATSTEAEAAAAVELWSTDDAYPLTHLPCVFTPTRETVRKGVTTNDAGDKASTLLVFRVEIPGPDRKGQQQEQGEHEGHGGGIQQQQQREVVPGDELLFLLKAVFALLEARLLRVLRTELSLVYSVSCSTTWRSLSNHALLNVAWSCDTINADTVLDVALRKIKQCGGGGDGGESGGGDSDGYGGDGDGCSGRDDFGRAEKGCAGAKKTAVEGKPEGEEGTGTAAAEAAAPLELSSEALLTSAATPDGGGGVCGEGRAEREAHPRRADEQLVLDVLDPGRLQGMGRGRQEKRRRQ